MITNVEELVCPYPPNRRPLRLDREFSTNPLASSTKDNIMSSSSPSSLKLRSRQGEGNPMSKKSILSFLLLKQNEKQLKRTAEALSKLSIQ